MSELILQPDQAKAIREHGERGYPHEVCGFLLGRIEDDRFLVNQVLPATNSKGEEERHNRFMITPEASLRAEKAARLERLDIIGHYHSHPEAPARPSEGFPGSDLENATWPGSAFAIVSIQNGQAADLTSWLLAEDRSKFEPQPITLETTQETP